jgi:predicted transposase YbfD/YdcC
MSENAKDRVREHATEPQNCFKNRETPERIREDNRIRGKADLAPKSNNLTFEPEITIDVCEEA